MSIFEAFLALFILCGIIFVTYAELDSIELFAPIVLVIQLVILTIILFGIIDYFCKEKIVISNNNIYEIFWIEDNPYIKYDNKIISVNEFLKVNVPTNTKKVEIYFEEWKMKPYGIFYPINSNLKIISHKFIPDLNFKLLPNDRSIDTETELIDTCEIEEKMKTV